MLHRFRLILLLALTCLCGSAFALTGEYYKPSWLLDSSGNIIGYQNPVTGKGVAPTFIGGSITGLATNCVRSSGTGAFDLCFANTENLTASHTLTIKLNNADRTLDLGGGVGAKNGATVTVAEQGDGVLHKTILTLASTPVTVANTTGASFGGVKLYDLPVGRVLVLGVTANLSLDWSLTTIALTGSGDFSMGTTITADATLDGSDVDLLPSTGLLDPFVGGVGTGKGALAASAQFDGTTTGGGAKDVNLNLIIDDADVGDGASDIVLVSGTATVTWINLGDY